MKPRHPLIIGNSHTAAVRIALRDQPERWPGFAPDVFAMPGGSLGDLELRDRSFHPTKPVARKEMVYYNGVPDLPLAGHDAFVVVGGVAFSAQAAVQDRHRSLDFPSVQNGLACTLVSTGFVDAMLRRRIANSPAVQVLRALLSLDQGPVMLMDTVLPSVECRADPQNFAAHVDLAARGDGAAYHARYLRILREVIGPKAIHLPQPARTIVDQVFTGAEWMRGSIRMQPRKDVPHEINEYGHANAAYGALQVDAMVAAFERL